MTSDERPDKIAQHIMPVFIVLLGFVGIAGTVWKFWIGKGTFIERAIEAANALSAAALAVMLLARIVQLANADWIEAKLAPVVGMTYSYPLYQDPKTGVMTAWIYGPIGALVLLPAAIAKHPTTARIIGNSIMALCSIVPTIWLLWMSATSRTSRAVATAAFLVFGWMLIYAEDLGRCATIAGADAPAIALAVCACAFIWRKTTITTCCLSALSAVLCIWTKQNFGLLMFGLIAYLAVARNLKTAGIYAAMLMGWGIIVSAILCYCFGASRLYFHMVTIPTNHPLTNSNAGLFFVWGTGLIDMVQTCSTALGLLFIVLVLDAVTRAPAASVREWVATRNYSLLMIAAFAVFPGSLFGYLKISGYVNNLGCTNHLILLAALVGAIETCNKGEPERVELVGRIVSKGLGIFALMLAIWCTLGRSNGLVELWPTIVHPYDNQEEAIFKYVKLHPGEVYCPWDPLTTLLADGKLYHFEWGLADRIHARRLPMPSNEQYEAHLPKRLTKIVYTRAPLSSLTLDTILNFRQRTQIPELPGCVVYIQQVQ